MEAVIAYVGLGSNLNQPQKQLEIALTALTCLPETRLVQASRFYQSSAMTLPQTGADFRAGLEQEETQPDFINAVAEVITYLDPIALLDALQAIEKRQGRDRSQKHRWGARTLDLDLLFYGNKVMQTKRLTLPHYGIKNRDFVIKPLLEIAPGISFPDGSKVADFLSSCGNYNLVKL